MKKAVLSALVVAALAGTATAQVRLELRLVRQTGTPPGTVTDVDVNGSVTVTPGASSRFELQYRVLDLDENDNFFPAGLSSATIDITSSTGTLLRAQLSRYEAQSGATNLNPPPNPDSTGLAIGSTTTVPEGTFANADRRGLHVPFRGGLVNASLNDLPSNGIGNVDTNPDPALFAPGAGNTLLSITPLAIAASNQGNILLGADNNTWYGLYSFDYVAGSANDTISASTVADAGTGNRFGWFTDGNAVPQTSSNATSASYSIIVPSPGAVALLGLGGLMVARRRRN